MLSTFDRKARRCAASAIDALGVDVLAETGTAPGAFDPPSNLASVAIAAASAGGAGCTAVYQTCVHARLRSRPRCRSPHSAEDALAVDRQLEPGGADRIEQRILDPGDCLAIGRPDDECLRLGGSHPAHVVVLMRE